MVLELVEDLIKMIIIEIILLKLIPLPLENIDLIIFM